MKHVREIKVAVLAMIALFLLYFGFNYLKGTNVFKPVYAYHGMYMEVNGLVEQAPVYVKGFKVGQVDHIYYDFTRDSSFLIDISINKDIRLPHGTTMALVADGLLGGTAVQLNIPVVPVGTEEYAPDTYLPTIVVPGLMESLQSGIMLRVGSMVDNIDSLVQNLNDQLADNHLKHVLGHVDTVTSDLTYVSKDLKRVMRNDVPGLLTHFDSIAANVDVFAANIRDVDVAATVSRVDSVMTNVNGVVTDVRNPSGTIGKLLYDQSLYNHIDATVVSADSLVTDLKANPKRYVHFSLFGRKEKK